MKRRAVLRERPSVDIGMSAKLRRSFMEAAFNLDGQHEPNIRHAWGIVA
ncbi:hypothetical protein SAMN05444340_1431 [Citreimonas salinaria]|uniref:Uncharacterized protein n=1 Tax=Citreimonas salinaria TaxID=321339 RepID=A0A1H3P1P3_9RHOB|nr:hypothetical protein SAMN05444340_1431 [Citreimonas salinaria]